MEDEGSASSQNQPFPDAPLAPDPTNPPPATTQRDINRGVGVDAIERSDGGSHRNLNAGVQSARPFQCLVADKFGVECPDPRPHALKSVKELSEDDKRRITSRFDMGNVNVAEVCEHHLAELIRVPRSKGQASCQGFPNGTQHKKSVKGPPLPASTYYGRLQGNTLGIFPGTPICKRCLQECTGVESTPKRQRILSDTEYLPEHERFEKFNSILKTADVECFAPKKLSIHRQRNAVVAKIQALIESCLRVLADDGLDIDYSEIHNAAKLAKKNELSLESVLQHLKAKYITSDYRRKVQVLTVAPSNWTINETAQFFSTDECKCPITQVKKAQKLRATEGPLSTPAPRKRQGVKTSPRQLIKEYYCDDSHSRMFPGMNDTCGVVENGVKTRKTKRLILMSLKELHKRYMVDHGAYHPISFSRFCSIRPREMVLASARGVHNVCVCVYHGNVKLMLEAIGQGKEFRSLLMDSLVCNTEMNGQSARKVSCMLGTCKECKRASVDRRDAFETLVKAKLELRKSELVTYSQWTSMKERGGLQTVTASEIDFIESLYQQFVVLLPHHFVSGTQAAQFKQMRNVSDIGSNTAVVQVDFGENYSFMVQDAPQSFHWETAQATIHPFSAWIKCGDKVKCISAAVISDERQHDTETFFAFQKVFLKWLLEENSQIKHIEYWSDGCAGQYKNCKNFNNLSNHFDDFGVTASWNFFATSHGKGAVDGISSLIKQSARRKSMRATNDGHIMTPMDLFNHCTEELPGVRFFYVTKEDVERISDEHHLDERFGASKTYPQTRMCHKLSLENGSLRMYRTTSDNIPFYFAEDPTPDTVVEISIGDWLAVRYLATWYLAKVIDTNEEVGLTQVHFVDTPGNSPSYKFSGREEHNISWINHSDIVTKVSPFSGKTTRTRSHFYLSESERSMIEQNV